MVGATMSAGASPMPPSAGVTITRTGDLEYQVTFDFGITATVGINSGGLINVLLTIPDSLRNTAIIRGLLGNSDDNSTNDFITRTGEVLSDDISDRDLHFMFGLTCESGIIML